MVDELATRPVLPRRASTPPTPSPLAVIERRPPAGIELFADAGHTLPIEERGAVVHLNDEAGGRRVAPRPITSP